MNSYFQFKQFIIHQENCAMKVCTDACLFGAWVADKLNKKEINPKKIFDIGCGTGLLSLMLAQKTTVNIDAIEIDAEAFLQATENVAISPWKDRVNIFHGPLNQFAVHEKYDFIICNPPFYENQLKSDNEGRNAAMHSTTLSFLELASAIKNNLSNTGQAAVLIPFTRVADFEKNTLQYNLFIKEHLHFSHTPSHSPFRSILLLSNEKRNSTVNNISIKDNAGLYSEVFTLLLKDYYLHF